jgi:Flp pilus assembly protein TadD
MLTFRRGPANGLGQSGLQLSAKASFRAKIVEGGVIRADLKVPKHLKLRAVLVLSLLIYQPGTACHAASADKHFQNAIELRFRGESEGAIDQYRKGLSLRSDDADAHMQLGILLLDEKGDLDGAISEFVTALGVDPNFKVCQSRLDDAIERRNSSAADLVARGNRFYASGELKRALAGYRVALKVDAKDATAHNSLAWTLYRMGKLDEGLFEVREALRLKPNDPEFVNTLASILFDQGDVSGAAGNFQKAISLVKTPNPADLYGLAAVSVTRGDTSAAAKYFSEALKLDPKYDDAAYLRDRIGLSVKTLSNHDRLLSLTSKP